MADAAAKTMDEVQNEAHTWGTETFGVGPHRVFGVVSHLADEVRELEEALNEMGLGDEGVPKAVLDEVGDVGLLILEVAGLLGVSLREAVERKLAVNRTRKWGKPDARGVVKHVEES